MQNYRREVKNMQKTARNNKNIKQKTFFITAIYIFMITMNFLANFLPLNDVTTEVISDRYENIFTPAGFTFAIWGLVYLALGLLVIYLIIGVLKGYERSEQIVNKIFWPFVLSSLFNGLWIFAWHYDQIFLTLLLMVGILFSLIWLYRKLKSLPFAADRYLLPISIYLGWISVATVANVTVFSVSVNWGQLGLSDELWLAILLLAVLLIAAYMLYNQNDVAFNLVILWALTGIFAARLEAAEGLNLAAFLPLLTGILLLALLINYYRLKQKF